MSGEGPADLKPQLWSDLAAREAVLQMASGGALPRAMEQASAQWLERCAGTPERIIGAMGRLDTLAGLCATPEGYEGRPRDLQEVCGPKTRLPNPAVVFDATNTIVNNQRAEIIRLSTWNGIAPS